MLFDRSQFILQGSTVLVFIVVLAILSQFSVLSVESVNIELALLDLQMSLLDLTFLIADLLLFLLELDNQLLEFLLEVAILVSGVEVINLDSADFVGNVLNLNFLLADVLVSHLRLLKEVSTRLLDGLLLRSMVDDLVTDVLRLRVKRHDRLLEDGLLVLNVGLLLVHASGLALSLIKGSLQHGELLLKTVLLSLDIGLALL